MPDPDAPWNTVGQRVRGLAEQLSPSQLSRLWQMLLKALEEAGKAPDPIAAVEMAMVRLCAAQSLPPPEDAARLLRDGSPSWTAGASPAGSTPSAQKSPTVNAAPPQPAWAPAVKNGRVYKAMAWRSLILFPSK